MTKRLFAGVAMICMPAAALADEAHVHFDVSPLLVNGKIVTEGISHMVAGNRYWSPQLRVFEFEFGGNPLFPRLTDHPGIHREPGTTALDTAGNPVTLGGTGLPSGSILSVTFVDDLKYWNGSDFVAVPNGESIKFTFGYDRTVGTGTGELAPLGIHYFGVDSLHYHLAGTLNGGIATPEVPTPGVYLVAAKLESDNVSVADSSIFWMVYGYQADEEAHEAAVAYVQANYVPEPSSALAVLGGIALAGLRRRSRH